MYFLVCGTMALVISVILFILVLTQLPHHLLLRKAELLPANQLRPGFRAVEGVVLPMEVLKSPISNQFCVYCNYMIQWYKGGKGAHWVTEANKIRYKKFLIQDKSGAVMVDPRNAKIEKPFNVVATSVRGRFKSLIKENRVATTNWLGFKRRMRCVEFLIVPDEKLTVVGMVSKDRSVPTPDSLVMGEGPSKKKFMISTKPFHKIKSNAKNMVWGFLIAALILLVFGFISFLAGMLTL